MSPSRGAELCPAPGWAFNGSVLIERDREVERLPELLADAVDGVGVWFGD